MLGEKLYNTYQRYRTLRTDIIHSLPVVILMPHSACNCRCVMCDIWKDNKNLKQLQEADIEKLLISLKKLGTKQVVMSGGEAMLNTNFFSFCKLLKKNNIKISVLSTGLTLKKNAEDLIRYTDDTIVSLDGDTITHNQIRNIPNAFEQLEAGIAYIKSLNKNYRISSRTVIHRINFRKWSAIIEIAKAMQLDQVSFLPVDVSSHAFNREFLWSNERQHEILIPENELTELDKTLEHILTTYKSDFENKFIAESPEKLRMIPSYYKAFYGHNEFPYKKCNAPWVSAVVEADGTVRPCFFHDTHGNIHQQQLHEIVNNKKAIAFRKGLNTDLNDTCKKCVCYLHLSPSNFLQ